MGRQMAGNSFISNFKKLPRAAAIAVAVILCFEIGSWVLLQCLKPPAIDNDLIGFRGFFVKPLTGISQDVPSDPRYACRKYKTVNDMAKHGPYDVIVIGSSVAETGWVDMLRLDYGYAIGVSVLEAGFNHPLAKFIPVISDYPKINNNRKAVFLWVDLAERDSKNYKNMGDLSKELRDYGQRAISLQKLLVLPSKNLAFYFEHQIESMYKPLVKTITIDGRDELFYMPDVNGLNKKVEFSQTDRLKLSHALKSYKDAVAARGCVFAMAAFPTKPQQYEWLINREEGSNIIGRRDNLKALEMAAKENNIPFLDLENELGPIARKMYAQDKQLLWNRAQSHMNAISNRHVAQIMKSFLEKIQLEKQIK